MSSVYGDVGTEEIIVGPTVQKHSNIIIRYTMFDNENKLLKNIHCHAFYSLQIYSYIYIYI